jgi:hypothetical protein
MPQTPACPVAQEVESACADACAELAMPMPLAVSLSGGDATRLPQQLLSVLRSPEGAIPLTPSLKVKRVLT